MFKSTIPSNIAGISFKVPYSFDIFIYGAKSNGIMFIPKKNYCRIDIYTIKGNVTDNIKKEFINFLNPYIHGEIEEHQRKNLYALKAIYEIGEKEYFEIRFGQHKDFDRRLNLLITVNKNKANIHEILNRRNIRKFLNSFQINDY